MRPKKRFRGEYRRQFQAPQKIVFHPSADADLKKVFAEIGQPAPERFRPDRFQETAVAAIQSADCLVTAPTGAGKTWIAEQTIHGVLSRGGRSWYTAPLKALSNAKYREFSEIFGADRVGILTGDRKENPNAPIIVGTTEILRNQLYDAMHRGEEVKTDFVVLDEAHYLGDAERGVVWEEIIIYLPKRVALLLLSATVGNAKQFSGWISQVRSRPCKLVNKSTRPVPLFPLFLHPSGRLYPVFDPREPKKKLHRKVADFVLKKNPPVFHRPRQTPPFGDFLRVLKKHDLLPAIFFLKSRSDCDHAMEKCMENTAARDERYDQRLILLEQFTRQSEHVARHRHRWHLEHLAVGSHHSGQLPMWKLLLENLMSRGLLDAVFATSTVAAGVDFPARSVVFLNSDRFNGTEFLPLSPTEFHQMTGRAGRRGKDKIGFAVAVPTRFNDIRRIARIIHEKPSAVLSQIHINFSMVLNLLLSHSPAEIEMLLQKSFAAYLIAQKGKKEDAQRKIGNDHDSLVRDFRRHLRFLAKKNYVDPKGMPTAEGAWAAQLRVDQPLLIAESLKQRLLPQHDPSLLAAVIAAFVNEREFDERTHKGLFRGDLGKWFFMVKQKLAPLQAEMVEHGFSTSVFYPRPAAAIHAWAKGNDWEEARAVSGMEDGSLVMLILRTADHLRHIAALQSVFPETAQSAARAAKSLIRDPVLTDTVL